jgi:hypothetical protein
VNEVFGKESHGKVPMEKVTMLIWQFRDDPSVVQFMARFVAKVRAKIGLFLFYTAFVSDVHMYIPYPHTHFFLFY